MAKQAEVEEARNSALVAAERRKQRLDAWQDYTGFVVTRLAGLACASAGVLDVVSPNLIPAPLIAHNALQTAGIGLGLLAGKDVIVRIARLITVMGG